MNIKLNSFILEWTIHSFSISTRTKNTLIREGVTSLFDIAVIDDHPMPGGTKLWAEIDQIKHTYKNEIALIQRTNQDQISLDLGSPLEQLYLYIHAYPATYIEFSEKNDTWRASDFCKPTYGLQSKTTHTLLISNPFFAKIKSISELLSVTRKDYIILLIDNESWMSYVELFQLQLFVAHKLNVDLDVNYNSVENPEDKFKLEKYKLANVKFNNKKVYEFEDFSYGLMNKIDAPVPPNTTLFVTDEVFKLLLILEKWNIYKTMTVSSHKYYGSIKEIENLFNFLLKETEQILCYKDKLVNLLHFPTDANGIDVECEEHLYRHFLKKCHGMWWFYANPKWKEEEEKYEKKLAEQKYEAHDLGPNKGCPVISLFDNNIGNRVYRALAASVVLQRVDVYQFIKFNYSEFKGLGPEIDFNDYDYYYEVFPLMIDYLKSIDAVKSISLYRKFKVNGIRFQRTLYAAQKLGFVIKRNHDGHTILSLK